MAPCAALELVGLPNRFHSTSPDLELELFLVAGSQDPSIHCIQGNNKASRAGKSHSPVLYSGSQWWPDTGQESLCVAMEGVKWDLLGFDAGASWLSWVTLDH